MDFKIKLHTIVQIRKSGHRSRDRSGVRETESKFAQLYRGKTGTAVLEIENFERSVVRAIESHLNLYLFLLLFIKLI